MMRRFVALAALLTLGAALHSAPAPAATIIVNTTADPGGSCPGSACSLYAQQTGNVTATLQLISNAQVTPSSVPLAATVLWTLF